MIDEYFQALNLDFPNKLIYVVPLRTLANSLRQRAEDLAARWSKIYPLPHSLTVTLQTFSSEAIACNEQKKF